MNARYDCPISACAWFYQHTASPDAPERPADVLLWTAATWCDMSERINNMLTVAQIVDAHLVTHSPVQWMTEMARERRKTEAVTADRDRLQSALEQTANGTAGIHPVASMRLPSRDKIEAIQTARIGVANGGAADA